MRTFQFILLSTIILFSLSIQQSHAQFWEEDNWGISYLGNNVRPPAHLGIGIESEQYFKAMIASSDTYGALKVFNNSNYETGDRTYSIYANNDSEFGGQKVGIYNFVSRKGMPDTERIGLWNILEQDDNSQAPSYGVKQTFYAGPEDVFGIDQRIEAGKKENFGVNSVFQAKDKRFGAIIGSNTSVELNQNSSGIVYGNRIFIPNVGTGLHLGLYIDSPGEDNFAAIMNGRVSISEVLGIGQMPPSGYRLAVAGKIIAEELVIELASNWPDYVFANDYDLMPLEEVEAFIEKEKHLPGIAPAKEIEEDGLSIGETQRKMMEKIEELTLYMIDLKKENQALKTRLDELTK